MKSLKETRKELCCGWKRCCPRGQSSVRRARVKGTLTIPWNVSQPIQAWNSLTSSRNSYTLSRWRAPIDIQRSNFVSCFASLYEFRFIAIYRLKLSHSAVPIFKKTIEKEISVWRLNKKLRTKIIRKMCVERKIRYFLQKRTIIRFSSILKLVVNVYAALV